MRTKSTIRFAEVVGGGLDFRPPPNRKFGGHAPSPSLYYSIRLYVSRQSYWGWGDLDFRPPPYSDVGGGVMTPLSQW